MEFEDFRKEVTKQLDFYDKVGDEFRRMLKRTLTLYRMMKKSIKKKQVVAGREEKVVGSSKIPRSTNGNGTS